MTRTLVLSLFLIFISYGVNSDVNSDVNSGVNTILLFIIIQRYIYSGGNLWVWGMNKTKLFIFFFPLWCIFLYVAFISPPPHNFPPTLLTAYLPFIAFIYHFQLIYLYSFYVFLIIIKKDIIHQILSSIYLIFFDENVWSYHNNNNNILQIFSRNQQWNWTQSRIFNSINIIIFLL